MKSCRQSLRHLASDTNDTLPDFPFNCHCVTFHTWSLYETSPSHFVLTHRRLDAYIRVCECDMERNKHHFERYQMVFNLPIKFQNQFSSHQFQIDWKGDIEGSSTHRAPVCHHNYHDAAMCLRVCVIASLSLDRTYESVHCMLLWHGTSTCVCNVPGRVREHLSHKWIVCVRVCLMRI